MGGDVFVVRKVYGQKCELGKKIVPCAIIYTGDKNTKQQIKKNSDINTESLDDPIRGSTNLL